MKVWRVRHVLSSRVWWRCVLWSLLAALWLGGASVQATGAGAGAYPTPDAEPVVLGDRRVVVDPWPAVSVLFDTTGHWTLDEVRQRLPQRQRPTVPKANFGERRGALWLVWDIDLQPAARGAWLLDVAFPPLDLVDLHVLHDGEPLPGAYQQAGDGRPMSVRRLPARTHVLPLDLAPGRYTLLLRVASEGSLVTPLRLVTLEQFHQGEDRVQLLQGVSTGVMLCLLLYSLAQWFSLRDRLFACYGLSVFGIGLFLFSYNGLGLQHVWGEHVRVSEVVSPGSVLLSVLGAFLFIDRVLDIQSLSPRVSRVMQAGAVVAAVAIVLLLMEIIDYRQAQQVTKVMGPLPMFLALPFAWMRWRQGDRAAAYVFLGWALYAVGGVTMGRLVNGQVEASLLTLHALQAGSLAEMLLWLLVMGMRVEQLRGQAELARQDGDRLRRLAETDALTGLLNRRGLHAAVGPLMARLRPGRLAAVYLIDLDGFKQINDQQGHETGDAVLVEVGVRLRAQVREIDLVSRTGGDEFVLLVADLPDDAAARRVGLDLISALEEPMALGERVCTVGATVGYALAPTDGVDIADLLHRADRAMYLGKQAGKRQVRRLVWGQ